MNNFHTLPQGWKIESFDNIKISNVIGLVRNSREQNQINSYKYLKMNNISNDNTFNQENIVYVEASSDELEKFSLMKGDFLFNTRNSIELVGKSCIFDSDEVNVLFNNNIMRVRFKSNISPYFIAYQFNSSLVKKQLELIKSGTTNVAAIYYKALRDLKLIIPPLEEQRRIVGVLDGLFGKIDKSIALLDESIASASTLMPSALNEVFEELKIKNEMVAVKQVIVNIQTGTTPSKQIEKYYKLPLEIEWFSPSDFKEEKILHSSKNKLNKIALEERKVKFYDENSLLLVAIGATVGKIGVIREKATSNQQITALKFDNSVNVDFAYYWFKHIKEFIIGQASTATLPIINQNGIKELPFIKVPLNIQTQTVAYLDALHVKADALKKAQEKKKEALLALKASLLESAFKGAL